MNLPESRNTLVKSAAAELSRMIQEGRFTPGEFLPRQKDLAMELGVGANTLREAIQGLVAVGLLQSHPGKGTWVRRDALDTLIPADLVRARLGNLEARALCVARSVIEVGLTELAAREATEEDIAAIRSALIRLEDSIYDNTEYVKADLAFHLAMAAGAHNELLEQFYHSARNLLTEFVTEVVRDPRTKLEANRFHVRIANAIANHDPRQARKASLGHMEFNRRLLQAFEASRTIAAGTR